MTPRRPARLATAALASAVPLFAFGGSVTTIGAGMAVSGWWNAEGHFMPAFPLSEWFRDVGTFVEHTHRLFGLLVGFFAIGTVIATLRSPLKRLAAWPIAALLAVVGQGTLGGFRVLENSPQLAFLHGALAQAVFALLAVTALVLAPRFRAGAAPPVEGAPRALAVLTAVAVYAQVFVGTWYRHGLRNAVDEGVASLFHLHVTGAVVVLALAVLLARALRRAAAATGGASGARLVRLARTLHLLLGVQLLLGVAAWLGYDERAVPPLEWVATVAHVVVGALLLAHVCCVPLWLARLARAPEPSAAPAGAVVAS